MITRRTVLQYSGIALAAGSIPLRGDTLPAATRDALGKTDVVYISPLKGDATESRCHGEVWYVFDGADVFVVTSSTAWRTKAIQRGLTRARLWVGEFGNWQDAKDAYRAAPEVLATGTIVAESAKQAQVLERFGNKYRLYWIVWGPRFRDGIADGSRVMLQYTPTA